MKYILTKLMGSSLYPLISTIIPLLAYAVILIIGVPQEVGLAVRYSTDIFLIPITLLLYLAYRQSGWTGTLASLSLTLIVFALPLSGEWNSGISDSVFVGGLLPWSDASDYYKDAKQLLEGGTFVFSRRPLFAGMLATLLGLTQQNLQLTLAALVAITAISCFLLAREIQRSHGIAAGLLVLTILFLFYRRFIGTTMTESLGLSLGALGWAVLWRGARQRQIDICLLAILLLTLALNARAGAFFVLPALILWGTWSFHGSSRLEWRFLLGGTSMVLLGFILNSVLLKIVGSPEGIAFSNFSYVLYGLIVGGNWTQVLVDHPELNGMIETEKAQKVYELAFEALRANPIGLVLGSIKAWILHIPYRFIYVFFGRSPKFIGLITILSSIAYISLYIFTFFALFICYRRRKKYNYSLAIASTIGIVASVPFAPPWDADFMRAYAATIPIDATLAALGLTFILRKLKWKALEKVAEPSLLTNSSEKVAEPSLLTNSSFIFGIALAFFIFLGPIATKALSHPPRFYKIQCTKGLETVYSRITPGSYINLVADDSISRTHLPNIRLSDFRKGLTELSLLYPNIARELSGISSSKTIVNTFNLKDGKSIWLITESNTLPTENAIIGVCGKPTTNPRAKVYGFFYADLIQNVSVINR